MLLFVSCASPEQRATYVPISQLEPSYGQLITVSNAPTPDQHGTGDRLGIFRDILRSLTMATYLDVCLRGFENLR